MRIIKTDNVTQKITSNFRTYATVGQLQFLATIAENYESFASPVFIEADMSADIDDGFESVGRIAFIHVIAESYACARVDQNGDMVGDWIV